MADRDVAPPLPLRTHQTHGLRAQTNSIPLPTRASRTSHHHTHPAHHGHHTHHVQSIDKIQTQLRTNDYVEIGTPALPPRRLPSTTRSHSQPSRSSRLRSSHHHDNHVKQFAELAVFCDDCPPPLMPRLPSRQTKPVTHRSLSTPQPPPIRRDTKPPIHKLESFHTQKQHHIHAVVSALLFVDTSSKTDKSDCWESRQVLPQPNELPQPVTVEPKEEKTNNKLSKCKTQQHATLDKAGRTQSVVRCADCGKCKCKSCCQARKLPERWLCDGNCRLSADTCVDLASCMCIAKGITYHVCDEQAGEAVEQPHSCTNTPRCSKRWATLGLLSLCFPCLLCYLPLKGGVKATEACYNSPRSRQKACKCDR